MINVTNEMLIDVVSDALTGKRKPSHAAESYGKNSRKNLQS
jgi:hypothetical protein